MTKNIYQRSLRDFQDYADDVTRSRHQTFDDAIRRLVSTLVDNTPLGDVVAQLPHVDFDQWYSKQLTSVGGMVGSGTITWPVDGRERLAMQVEMVRRLASDRLDIIDFSHNFMYVGSRFDDNIAEFIQQIFRRFIRDFLRFVHDSPSFKGGLQQRTPPQESEVSMTDELTLFISHSARDTEIAKSIVTLFEKAFKISARRIRCTSVDGYRLPAGADTNEVLRTEVFGAKLFVALLTPNSLSSPYVLFELGARWGTRRPLYPLLAGDTTPAHLSAPLSGLNALSMISADQVRQLLENASEALSQRLEPASSFSAEVEGVVAASTAISSNPTVAANSQAAEPSTVNLEDEQVKILLELAKQEWCYAEQIARAVGIGIQVVQYHLDELQNAGMASASYSMGGPTEWYLDHEGRKFLIKNRLIS